MNLKLRMARSDITRMEETFNHTANVKSGGKGQNSLPRGFSEKSFDNVFFAEKDEIL